MKKTVNGIEQEREPINAAHVISVYSGVDGACCCGCKGTHRFASSRVDEARRSWAGGAIDASEVNDRQVTKVVRLLNEATDWEEGAGHVATVIGKRIYIAYLSDEVA